MENSMVKITGLWKQEASKSGEIFYSGPLSYSSNILIFKNKFKQSEKDPDLILYVGKREQKKERSEDQDPEVQQDPEIPF